MVSFKKLLYVFIAGLLILACASSIKHAQYFDTVVADLQQENYQNAIKKVEQAKKLSLYRKKDRVLYYLDMGIIHFYQGDYQKSNEYFDRAETAMEELFTKSISNAAMSFVLNDNVLDYYGEVYENIYVNVFKAMNYIQLGSFDDAFVEIRRVNIKLRELEDKYRKLVDSYNRADTTGVKIQYQASEFYDDALAHYLSYIIYRADRSYDDARIEMEKLNQAWETQSDVYYFDKPSPIKNPNNPDRIYLNVFGFVGKAPKKIAVGGLITTYKDYIGISDLSQPIALPRIPFPGIKEGYHFKFAFPVMVSGKTDIDRIDVRIDGKYVGSLELLEDMGKVALKTFATKQKIIYLKTLVRTITKGLLAAKGKKKLRKKLKAGGLLGALIDAGVDLAVDATEQPDLRCWKTMPDKCLIGEYEITPGSHNIAVTGFSGDGTILYSKNFPDYSVKDGVNLVHFTTLQ